jgi:hypothetical protein
LSSSWLKKFQVDPVVKFLRWFNQNEKSPYNPPENTPKNHPFFRLYYLLNQGTYRPPFPYNSQTKPKMSPVSAPITPCMVRSTWIFRMKWGSGRNQKVTHLSDERDHQFERQNSPSFLLDRATPPALLSFATQKVLLAVIFCVDSAPDKPNEHQNEVFPK